MTHPAEQLKALGISLPPVSTPAAAYVPFVRSGPLVFLSGHIARRDWSARSSSRHRGREDVCGRVRITFE